MFSVLVIRLRSLRLLRVSGIFFFQAEDGIRDYKVTGVQTCALPILPAGGDGPARAYPLPDSITPWQAGWSRDGRTIYLKGVDREGRVGFWALPPAGGRPRLVVRFDDATRSSSRKEWATDGRRFYFTFDDRQSDIYVAELRGL